MEGGFRYMDNTKPIAPLIGANGNIFNLLSIARNCLISSNQHNKADEMWDRVTNSKSYNEALVIIGDYVEFGDSDERTTRGTGHTGHEGLSGSMVTKIETIGVTDGSAGMVRKAGMNGTPEPNEHKESVGKAGINNEDSKVGKVGTPKHKEQHKEFNSIKVDFTQELHITNVNIDEIMSIVLGEGILKWYESISSSPTNQENIAYDLISSGGTIFIKLHGEDYNRTFDKQDLIYGLLRKLPDCLYVINGTQIDTTSLSNEDIDHIIQYGIFGEIKFRGGRMERGSKSND